MTTFEENKFGMFFIFFVFVAQTEFNTLVQNRQFKYFVLFFKLSLEVVLDSGVKLVTITVNTVIPRHEIR
jgi:hypothetical protein